MSASNPTSAATRARKTAHRLDRRTFLAAGAAAFLTPSAQTLAPPASPLFEEIAPAQSRIVWTHENAKSANRYLPESLGPGCAFLDFDNDGWMDIYLVNSGPSDFWTPAKPMRNALYKNNRDGTFTDVTEKAGVAAETFGMGVAVADYDNDGWPDIFVTAYGRCTLYRNNHDGTFTDVTAKAGLTINGWTTSAVWFDYDNDGLLDLFICSFVDYAAADRLECGDNRLGKHYYCIPRVFKGTSSFLFRNNGNGTFTDVSSVSGIAKSIGKGLGVVATDVNNDRRLDLFVANDTVQNFLYINLGPGARSASATAPTHFEEIALQAEVALSDNGQPRSGMGVDSADVFGSGHQDLFVANIDQEMYSLYRNHGAETFRDVALTTGVAQATRFISGWGLKFFDYDNDGRIDLLLANGHPDDMIESYSHQVHYQEPLLLFHNDNEGKLANVSAEAGPVFQRSYSARGLAVGDFDNDGAVDVLIGVNGGAPLLLRNNAARGNNWLGLKLRGVTCNRDAIGAVLVWKAGGKTFRRLKTSGGSYLSSHDPREVLGFGGAPRIDQLEIHWPAPSTRVDNFSSLPVNRYIEVVEGTGTVSNPTQASKASLIR